jgi:hypothetical protein
VAPKEDEPTVTYAVFLHARNVRITDENGHECAGGAYTWRDVKAADRASARDAAVRSLRETPAFVNEVRNLEEALAHVEAESIRQVEREDLSRGTGVVFYVDSHEMTMPSAESSQSMGPDESLQIIADYHSYVPPPRLEAAVKRLLSSVPAESLTGLQSVVITDRDRYSTKVKAEEALSFYHQQTRERRPWIELFVDNIFRGYPRWLLVLPLLQELLLAEPLFHEIAHHRDAHIRGMRTSVQERRADGWAAEARQQYFARRYWHLKPVVWVFVKGGGRVGKRRGMLTV